MTSDTSLIHDPSTNVPDYAVEESARLDREFINLKAEVAEMLALARDLPKTVENPEQANDYTTVITRMRDLDKKVEGFRGSEGTPYLRRKDAVDAFFFSLREKLFKRKKTDKNGGADILAERLHAYNLRRLEAERLERERVAREAQEAENRAREERDRLEREQREAEERAARARKPENKQAAEAEADVKSAQVAAATVQEETARATRQDAEVAAKASPADLVRERHSGGAMNTMQMEWYVEIADAMALDPAKLWAFVKDDAKLAALRAWAKITQHKQPMAGAIIEERPKTVVRR